MKIGSFYTVKEYFWLLFPTKETATTTADTTFANPLRLSPAYLYAAWSIELECITYFSPDSIVVFLEEDGVFKKVLTSDGLVGWTWFTENYNDCFEEVRAE